MCSIRGVDFIGVPQLEEPPGSYSSTKKVSAIDFDKMKDDLQRYHANFLAFAKEAYAETYK